MAEKLIVRVPVPGARDIVTDNPAYARRIKVAMDRLTGGSTKIMPAPFVPITPPVEPPHG